MRRIVCLLFFLSLVLFLCVKVTRAEDFKSDYQVDYTPVEKENGVDARVQFTVSIKNLRSDIYIKKVSFSFPKSQLIRDIQAFDDSGKITPNISYDAKAININLELNSPKIGIDGINILRFEFIQSHIFEADGNIWEVILPTLDPEKRGNYTVNVHLPSSFNKKISIAKPAPTTVDKGTISWVNPQVKTIYAAFGDSQYYTTKLTYHLINDRITPVYTDIAFPPDTLYQKIFVQSIDPKPNTVFTDSDGNYIGRYILAPRQNINVNFIGLIEVYAKPRSDIEPLVRKQIEEQKKYLLNGSNVWNLEKGELYSNLKTSAEIYSFVKSTLSYDYSRSSSSNKRLGAEVALQNPTKAVCVEFSDTFIALAREKGILAREIQGYGFSRDSFLRPLSLNSDVLHSWPEYYDPTLQIWVPIDPTWENTSGIDYYNSFDYNHVVFAIHGKQFNYPLPAGMYKVENTKDISILPTTTNVDEKEQLRVLSSTIPRTIVDSNKLLFDVEVANLGNTYIRNTSVGVKSALFKPTHLSQSISSLAPFEKTVLHFSLLPNKVKRSTGTNIVISGLGITLESKEITIVPGYYGLALIVSIIILSCLSLFFIIKLVFTVQFNNNKAHAHRK